MDEEYFLEVDIQYLENLYNLHHELLFFPKTMKIKNVEKLVANLNDKTKHAFHIHNLKQTLNHGLVLKKV